MPRGGYRRPSEPAPVSGPGKLSRRTDGGPMQGPKVAPGGKYGERKASMEAQSAAPMAGSQAPNKIDIPAPVRPPVVPLTAPSERPDEPITSGSPFGPGVGPEALVTRAQSSKVSDVIGKIVDYDSTGQLNELYDYLITRGL